MRESIRSTGRIGHRDELNADDAALQSVLYTARTRAGLPSDEISINRCFDVIVWMIGKRAGRHRANTRRP
ncbi:MAG TPA: DUF6308 family protein [Aldersonia sp.]